MSLAALIRRLRTALIPLCVLSVAACGGGGSNGGGALPATSTPVTPATPLPLSIISNQNGVIDLTGSITAMITGGFQVQGGHGVGYLHIYTNSATVVTGPKPFIGENVEVVGTGSLSTGDITATKVSDLSATPAPAPTASAPPAMPVQATPTPVSSAPPAAAASPIPVPAGVYAQTGQILSVLSNRLTINAGAGCGSMYVYLNSATAYFNGSPAAGEYGYFTGTGTRCSAITAKSVSLSGAPFTSTTLAGTVAAATTYGFTLNAGSGSAVPVALSSATIVFGGTLAPGASVTVSAYGSAAAGLTATQVAVAAPTPAPAPAAAATPTPGPISMTHVPVFAYIYGYAGTPSTVPLSSMAPYVTWTQTDPNDAAAVRAAGVKVQVYANYWRNYSSDNPAVGYTDLKPGGAHAAAEAKDCSGNAVYDSAYGGGYEADARSSSALAHAQTVLDYRINEYGSNYDAVFADDTGAVWGITLPCNYDEASYDAAVNAIHSTLGMPMWVNALGAAPDPANAIDLAQPSNVIGAMCEICYGGNGSSGDYLQTGTSWLNVENAEIGMVAQHKVFWDYARLTGSASAETAQRLYVYASFLLGYDPSYAMFQEALSTPGKFPVMPETGLVPTGPLTTQSSAAAYQQPGGAFMREFSACYYRGSFVGKCAVVVNPGAASVPVPTMSYAHAMVLSGNGVLDGGTVSFSGSAPTQLAPASAAILFP